MEAMTVQRCPEVRQGQQCILEVGHTTQHRADWAVAAPVLSTAMGDSRRTELDGRLLGEARSRAETRALRRFLLLIAAAVCIVGYGLKESPALAVGAALVLIALAIVIALRGRGPLDL